VLGSSAWVNDLNKSKRLSEKSEESSFLTDFVHKHKSQVLMYYINQYTKTSKTTNSSKIPVLKSFNTLHGLPTLSCNGEKQCGGGGHKH